MAFCSPIEICIEIETTLSYGTNGPGFSSVGALSRSLQKSIAASIHKLLVVLVMPTQREPSIIR